MKEHPILFSGEMVCAILDERKTQTRRIIKNPVSIGQKTASGKIGKHSPMILIKGNWLLPNEGCPYGEVGDNLYVKESFWQNDIFHMQDGPIKYCATDENPTKNNDGIFQDWIKKPSIHMPRWASRIILEIKNIRVERLQDIDEEDAFAEGIQIDAIKKDDKIKPLVRISGNYLPLSYGDPTKAKSYYAALWDSLNAKRGFLWNSNPWVWVIEFEQLKVSASCGA